MHESSSHLPGELMDRFHQAKEKLHERRMELEKAMEGTEFRHGERVAAAQDEFRRAEREMEEVEEKISKAISADLPRSQPK